MLEHTRVIREILRPGEISEGRLKRARLFPFSRSLAHVYPLRPNSPSIATSCRGKVSEILLCRCVPVKRVLRGGLRRSTLTSKRFFHSPGHPRANEMILSRRDLRAHFAAKLCRLHKENGNCQTLGCGSSWPRRDGIHVNPMYVYFELVLRLADGERVSTLSAVSLANLAKIQIVEPDFREEVLSARDTPRVQLNFHTFTRDWAFLARDCTLAVSVSILPGSIATRRGHSVLLFFPNGGNATSENHR